MNKLIVEHTAATSVDSWEYFFHFFGRKWRSSSTSPDMCNEYSQFVARKSGIGKQHFAAFVAPEFTVVYIVILRMGSELNHFVSHVFFHSVNSECVSVPCMCGVCVCWVENCNCQLENKNCACGRSMSQFAVGCRSFGGTNRTSIVETYYTRYRAIFRQHISQSTTRRMH